jgi:phosphoglycolate phosphatase-like HAD superfamily hydrolase
VKPPRTRSRARALAAATVASVWLGFGCGPRTDTHPRARSAETTPLASWNDGAAKAAILHFVATVTTPGGPGYVARADRIAVFDNDGTLWAEEPIYVQLAFAMDQVKVLAPQHPEWQTKEPFKHMLAGDASTLLSGGVQARTAALAAVHAGVTTDEFEAAARNWLRTARHPKTGRPYTDMVYQPMLELLDYLRAHDFKTFIVSGGDVEFMRVFADSVYGIPPEQVVGSQNQLRFELRGGKPALVMLPDLQFVDDGPGKAAGIQTFIGRRPIAAFGNSDGDQQMLEWTWAGTGDRLALLVHHTDAEREWAYDRESPIGRLDKALDEARASGWTVVDMKTDWKRVFAHD